MPTPSNPVPPRTPGPAVRYAVAVGSGLVATLAFPPVGQGWLVLVSLVGLVWVIDRSPRRSAAALAGFGYGLAFFATLFPWLAELGVIALVPLVLVEAVFPAVFGWWLQGVDRRPARWVPVAAGAWALTEFLRERVPVGGFPWGVTGYALSPYLPARGAARWIGTTGWSVVVMALVAALVVWLRTERNRRPAALVAGATAALLLAGALLPHVRRGEPVRVAIAQASSPCPGTHCVDERQRIYQTALDLTGTLTPGSVDLVVWPEGTTGGYYADPVLDPAVAETIGGEARRIGAAMLVGGDRPISDTAWINANVAFDPQGVIVGEYRKRHPVPFGEYVPARALFGWIPELAAVPRDMVRGTRALTFDFGFGRFGSVISFESAFSRYARDEVNHGATFLVVATSQASYPYSVATDQLIGMTRMRSAELGIDVVHSSVSGRSGFITGIGEVGRLTPKAEPALLVGTVAPAIGGRTLYARLGDWLQLLAAGVALGLTVVPGIVRPIGARRSGEPVLSDEVDGGPAT